MEIGGLFLLAGGQTDTDMISGSSGQCGLSGRLMTQIGVSHDGKTENVYETKEAAFEAAVAAAFSRLAAGTRDSRNGAGARARQRIKAIDRDATMTERGREPRRRYVKVSANASATSNRVVEE
jgi:hypothetical protein